MAKNQTNDFLTAPSHSPPTPTGPSGLSQSPEIKLPQLHRDDPFLGREDEIQRLDEAFQTGQPNIFTLVAWGGVGKSTLVLHWLKRLKNDNWRDAKRVYAWSFYSQGAAEGKQASADLFIDNALRWFGNTEALTDTYAKAERLAELLDAHKTVLILDGLEPLQTPALGEQAGALKDKGMERLLQKLEWSRQVFCLITTRIRLPLVDHAHRLSNLSPAASLELLRQLGVKGTEKELAAVAADYDHHALALNLLGRFLNVAHDGDVRKKDCIPVLMAEEKQGGHAWRVMAAYEEWLAKKTWWHGMAQNLPGFRNLAGLRLTPELSILYLLGLFDRPATAEAIAELRKKPVIKGLTEPLQNISEQRWKEALQHLRDLGLLETDAEARTVSPDAALDAHPLVREYFAKRLQEPSKQAARRAAHLRLYEYFKNLPAKQQPDTLDELEPLFQAVSHACEAREHQKALEEVYVPRIRSSNKSFIIYDIGAGTIDLALLSKFYIKTWSRPVDNIDENYKAAILNWTAFDLRRFSGLENIVKTSLFDFKRATEPLEANLKLHITIQDWENTARIAGNLSEFHLSTGDIMQAIRYGRDSVEYADKSGDEFQKMINSTAVADVLHQAGNLDEAEKLFREAEAMQAERQAQFPLLYSQQGYRFCDLLLSRGEAAEVVRRVEQTLEWGQQYGGLLDMALDTLSLGRAQMLLEAQKQMNHGGTENTEKSFKSSVSSVSPRLNALDTLTRAVAGLREYGSQQHLPRGLLARAAAYRLSGDFFHARQDLNEAQDIAARGGMKLWLTDCALEAARLFSAEGQGEAAAEKLTEARRLVEETGYHRRDGEVAELETAWSASAR